MKDKILVTLFAIGARALLWKYGWQPHGGKWLRKVSAPHGDTTLIVSFKDALCRCMDELRKP